MQEKITTQSIGHTMEDQALLYLKNKKFQLIERNFRCKLGEIDLIMRDGEFYVFIEVRYRKQNDYGEPIATVTRNKQRKIIRSALVYLQNHQLLEKVPVRFDVIAMQRKGKQIDIDWIPSAFDATN